MNLIEWLNALGDDAINELAKLYIHATKHPELPLYTLKYDMLDSPRFDPIVRQCRGTVVEYKNDVWTLIAKPFDRFFNLEEGDEHKKFDWNNFTCVEKLDGSLIIVYRYEGEWHANTSGSFGLGPVNREPFTWRDLFWQTYDGQGSEPFDEWAHPADTYIFELWTPTNMVVRNYPKPFAALIGVNLANSSEVLETSLDVWANHTGVRIPRPATYKAQNREDVLAALAIEAAKASDFEGFVLRDANGLRLKIKGEGYKAMHAMSGNGNIFLPKYLVPIVLSGEAGEAIATMKRNNPLLAAAIKNTEEKIEQIWATLSALWDEHGMIQNQKEFAMAIKGRHPLYHILFQKRKSPDKSLRHHFIDYTDHIIELM